MSSLALAAATATAPAPTSITASPCPSNPLFPDCVTSPVSPPTPFDETALVPVPPMPDSWLNLAKALQNSTYPILSTSPNPDGMAYGRGGASVNGEPWGPGNAATEVYACRRQGMWALTYEGGPTELTPSYLSSLASSNSTATFFPLGSALLTADPNHLKQAMTDGHQIGLSSYTGRRFTTLTTPQVISELLWSALATRATLGVVPRYIRPPHGDLDDRVRSIAWTLGLRTVRWNVETSDASLTVPDTAPGLWHVSGVVGRVNSSIDTGGLPQDSWMDGFPFTSFISVEHMDTDSQFAAAKGVLEVLASRDMRTVTVAVCDAQDSDAYLPDSHPFVQLLDSLPVPFAPSPPGNWGGLPTGGNADGFWHPGAQSFGQTPTGRMLEGVVGGLAAILVALVVIAVVLVARRRKAVGSASKDALREKGKELEEVDGGKGDAVLEKRSGFITAT
ncbi:chitin deacetylase [Irineochytrium annulatum]|nr:chitin deacetylase [Irineochytrium annulatum]